MHAGSSRWLEDVEFPIHFVDAIEDPDVLLYLPINRKLVSLIEDYLDPHAYERKELTRAVLRAARDAPGCPRAAAMKLLSSLGIPEGERDFLGSVETCFSYWQEGTPSAGRAATANTLWAFDTLLSLVSYTQSGDLGLPLFAAKHTYPLGRLVNLLPSAVLVDPLLRILHTDQNHQVLQYAAWCFGILNHPGGSEPWRATMAAQSALRARRAEVGHGWALADRQLLYTRAQLGSERARDEYISKLSNSEIGQFEAGYNWAYYEGNFDVMRDRFERRLEESRRTDVQVRSILELIYENLRPHMRTGDSPPLRVKTDRWAAY